jgi:hypothetical protein
MRGRKSVKEGDKEGKEFVERYSTGVGQGLWELGVLQREVKIHEWY